MYLWFFSAITKRRQVNPYVSKKFSQTVLHAPILLAAFTCACTNVRKMSQLQNFEKEREREKEKGKR